MFQLYVGFTSFTGDVSNLRDLVLLSFIIRSLLLRLTSRPVVQSKVSIPTCDLFKVLFPQHYYLCRSRPTLSRTCLNQESLWYPEFRRPRIQLLQISVRGLKLNKSVNWRKISGRKSWNWCSQRKKKRTLCKTLSL